MNDFKDWESLWEQLDIHYNSPEGFRQRVWDADYQFYFSVLVIFWYFCNWPKIQLIKLFRLLPFDLRIEKKDVSKYSTSRSIYIQPKDYYQRDRIKPRLRIYYSFPGISDLAFKINLGGEDDVIGFTFWMKAFFLSINLENVYRPKNYDWSGHEIESGFCLDWEEGYISFYWMSGIDDHGKFFHFKEFFLGDTIYKSETVSSDDVILRFENDPDGYPCTIQIKEDSWTYSRFPFLFKRIVRRCHMTSELGIPNGSKHGSDDRTYSSTFPCENIGEAINHIKGEVIKNRKVFGFRSIDPERLSEEISKMNITIEA